MVPKVRLESKTKIFNAMIQQRAIWWCNNEHSHRCSGFNFVAFSQNTCLWQRKQKGWRQKAYSLLSEMPANDYQRHAADALHGREVNVSCGGNYIFLLKPLWQMSVWNTRPLWQRKGNYLPFIWHKIVFKLFSSVNVEIIMHQQLRPYLVNVIFPFCNEEGWRWRRNVSAL